MHAMRLVSRGQPLPVVIGKGLGTHACWSCRIQKCKCGTKEFNTHEYIIKFFRTTIRLHFVRHEFKFQFNNSNMRAFPDPSQQQQEGAGHARLL